MAKTSTCPQLIALQSLAKGELPSPEMEPLLEHLESCETCLRKVRALPASSTLLDALPRATVLAQGPDPEILSRLIERLVALTGPATGPGVVSTNTVSFQCATCGKNLKVKVVLAGKKVRCPQCGKPVSVPAGNVADPSHASTKTYTPLASEARTILPREGAGVTDVAADPAEQEQWDCLAPPQEPGEIGRLGPYRVLNVLGAGGMGVVFRAQDPNLERIVALKAMLRSQASKPSARERFFREAKAAAALKHAHIVTIHQVGEDRDTPFLAMEFLEGEALDDRLKREGKLPVPAILRIGREIANGLAAAHERGLIHRDIKPANIWLEGKEGHVKILDFGLARALSDQTNLTRSGAIVGTPAYMAPEQAGGRHIDSRCDLFSLGCVLYRMCTGKMPFTGTDTIAILSALALDNPPPPAALNPDLPTELSDLVMQLLAKKPEERPGSAQTVAEALQALDQSDKVTKKADGGHPVKQRRPLVVAVAAGVAAAAVIAGIILLWPTPRGTVRIESADPTVEILFDKDGPTVKGAGKEPLLLRAGEHGVLIKRGDFTFEADKFLLKKGETITLKLEWIQGKVQVTADGRIIGVGKLPPGATAGPPPGDSLPLKFTNDLGMEFVLVPKGRSWLDGGSGKPGETEVVIAHDFYLGKYEVTQEEWVKVMGTNPSSFSRDGSGKEAVKDILDEDLKRFPVESVSWDNVQPFLKAVNAKVKEGGWVYRLPKMAEWKYACRGGPMRDQADSAFKFYFDKPTNELSPDQANFNNNQGLGRTCKVGSYRPNRLGLYDMHGNVWEWCEDRVNPDNPGSPRVLQSGSWLHDDNHCQAAGRAGDWPTYGNSSHGLRLARVPAGKDVVAQPQPSRLPDKKTGDK